MKLFIHSITFFAISFIVWELVLWITIVQPYLGDPFAGTGNFAAVVMVAPLSAAVSTLCFLCYKLICKLWLD